MSRTLSEPDRTDAGDRSGRQSIAKGVQRGAVRGSLGPRPWAADRSPSRPSGTASRSRTRSRAPPPGEYRPASPSRSPRPGPRLPRGLPLPSRGRLGQTPARFAPLPGAGSGAPRRHCSPGARRAARASTVACPGLPAAFVTTPGPVQVGREQSSAQSATAGRPRSAACPQGNREPMAAGTCPAAR